MKIMHYLICMLSFSALGQSQNNKAMKSFSPYEIIEKAGDTDWRDINLDETLVITLNSGTVIAELAPQFAPIHVSNTKKLVREGLFDQTSFYRVIDGFVAQGGPEDTEKLKTPAKGKLSIQAEFTITTKKPMEFTPLNALDGYSKDVGFIDGFTAGRTTEKNTSWLLHCYAALAMGRANKLNSGGTELYVVIGNAQRYLDRNTTVFGRIISGMDHIQSLQRSTQLTGPVDVREYNKIVSIKVASDLNKSQLDKIQLSALQIMRTDSDSFKALIESRKNRRNDWFAYQHNYIDACSVPVPSRLKQQEK